MNIKREIIISAEFEGLHCYPTAPREVSYLKNIHRHIFQVRVGIPVDHNERDREFFTEKKQLQSVLSRIKKECIYMSCETIAEQILKAMTQACWAEVYEDGENGSKVSYLHRDNRPGVA